MLTTTAFFGVTFALLTVSAMVPEIDTKCEFYRKFFYRGDRTFNTTFLPLGTLFFYWSMNVLGFVYVNVSNLNFSRRSAFLSNVMWYRDIFWTFLFAPFLFLVSGIIVLRSRENVASSPCDKLHKPCNDPYYSK